MLLIRIIFVSITNHSKKDYLSYSLLAVSGAYNNPLTVSPVEG